MSNVMYQCIGCGATIQTDDPNSAGYLPKSAFLKGQESGDFYCQRCFRLRHYNELVDLDISHEVFVEKLSQIAQEDAFIIYVVDLFDIEGSLISGLTRLIGDQDFVVAANKFDLLPKASNTGRIKHWVRQILHQENLRPEEVYLISAKKQDTLTELIQKIESQVLNRQVYIVGVTNVGKSTLTNQLINYYGGEREIITTSNHPGTTLDMIKIPLTEETAIIDTPGIVSTSQLAHYLSREDLNQVLATKTLKPRVYQLNPDQTIFLAGLARIDFNGPNRASFTYYVTNDLYLHRTKTQKADEFYQTHLADLLSPPGPSSLEKFPKLTPRKIKLKKGEDIAISGLGWLTANQEVDLTVWVPQGVGVTVRKSII